MTDKIDNDHDDNDQTDPESTPEPRKSNGQFASGFTGNPKGRPRKPKGREMLPRLEDLYAVLDTEMLKEQGYNLKGGGEKSLPYIVLLFRQMKIDALKGDKTARKQLLELWKEDLQLKREEKLKFFEAAHENEYLSFWELLELDKKM